MIGSLKAVSGSANAALVGLPRVNMHADPINKIKTTLSIIVYCYFTKALTTLA